MNKLGKTFSIIAILVLATFGLAIALDIEWLNEPKQYLHSAGLITALVAILLLSSDIILPVPSSVVMILMAHLFGFGWGMLISMLGMMFSTLLGYAIGKYSLRFSNTKSNKQAENFTAKWGDLALILSRGIPVLAESVAILSGREKMPFTKVVWSSFLGLMPTVTIYSLTGAYAFTVESNVLAFSIVLAIAGIVWLVKWRVSRKQATQPL